MKPDPLVLGRSVRPFEVVLVSMPWLKGDWPCLGIASLKSYLQAAGIAARCHHFHLDAAARLGWPSYGAIADVWGAGEALFGALCDPADADRLTKFAAAELRERGFEPVAEWIEGEAVGQLSALVDRWIDECGAIDAPVVGGSVGTLQLCSTLYMMQRLDARGHRGVRVLGGSGLVGSIATEILERVPSIDYVVNGEGEAAFLSLIADLRETGRSRGRLGVCSRDIATGRAQDGGRAPSINLSQAPTPDLSEFFATAARFNVPKTALTLSFEHSRGCEWEHRIPGQLKGCTFCGLYRTSTDYRRKSIARVADQIRESVGLHRNLNLAFVDAYLPESDRDELLDCINTMPEDITYFTELRCDLSAATVAKLSRRARRVQLGVESFSTALLRRIGKGLSAAQSVYCVRLCQEARISTQYNLMLHIPGATRDEIAGLYDNLPTLFGLLPPTVTRFYLDRNSLVFHNPERHGVCAASLDAERHDWLPMSLGDSRISQVVPFRPIYDDLGPEWEKVADLVGEWRERWTISHAAGLPSPLVWSKGAGWASIIDMRQQQERVFEIDGTLLDVFLGTDEVVSLKRLTSRLPHRDPTEIAKALQDLVSMRLVYKDGPRHVRVAVRHVQAT